MALDMVMMYIFFMSCGFGCLYLSFKRNAVMWGVFATIIFLSLTLYGSGIPFKTDAGGAIIPTAANYMAIGVSMLFMALSLLYTVYLAFQAFR